MNTKEMTQEQISAFADGELADEQVEVALAALCRADGRADWEIYHQIGDVLRSDDMDITLSSGFAARMAARLEQEPPIVAPVSIDKPMAGRDAKQIVQQATGGITFVKRPVKRWAMSGVAAAAAVATVAFITTPHLMVAMTGEPASSNVSIASSAPAASSNVQSVISASPQTAVVSADVPEGVVLRDPGIDDYLLAHQRFSPSVYSTAQYVRSATFANDSNK